MPVGDSAAGTTADLVAEGLDAYQSLGHSSFQPTHSVTHRRLSTTVPEHNPPNGDRFQDTGCSTGVPPAHVRECRSCGATARLPETTQSSVSSVGSTR